MSPADSAPSGVRLAVAFAVLPPAQALLAYVLFPLLWELSGTSRPDDAARAATQGAVITGILGLLTTLVAVPVVVSLIGRGQATLRRLLITGLLLGNLPFALYLGMLILPATLMHVIRGTLGNHLLPVPELLAAGARIVALGSTFGVLSAGLFWTLGIRPHARG